MPEQSGVIPLLQEAVQRLHRCKAVHCETVFVHEIFQGQTLWAGDVEIFDIVGHPKSKRCFAWPQPAEGVGFECVALLELWPVTSPETALRVVIALDAPIGSQTRLTAGLVR